MTFLLALIGWHAPPRDDAPHVIRAFVATLDRLDAAARAGPPATSPDDLREDTR